MIQSTLFSCPNFSHLEAFQGSQGCNLFFCPSPRICHFPQVILVPFVGEWLETKIWGPGVLITTGMPLLLGPLSCESKEIYVFIGMPLFNSIQMEFSFLKKI